MFSYAIVGGVGLLLNIVIAYYYGANHLGVFNQVYAIYILLSQLAVSGVHLSILKVTAQFSKEQIIIRDSFSAALFLTIITAGSVTVLAYVCKDFFAYALSSPEVMKGLVLALPGLFFFSLNKSFLALLNGLRQMKAYAVFQGLRFLLMLIFLAVLVALRVDGSYIPVIFSLTEAVLLIMQLPFTLRWIRPDLSSAGLKWMKIHWSFGLKAMVGNLLLDANSRADVLLLGLFASDNIVGVYSFAAMLAEGFAQLPVVLRTNINPILTQTYYDNGVSALESTMQRVKKLSYVFLIPVGLMAILSYPLLNLFGFDPEFNQSWTVFAILMMGILLSAGYLPFQMIFNQVGQPGRQTLFLIMFFLTNVILNLLFIPHFGMYGSAVATALALVFQIIYLKRLSFLWIGIRF
jgi:O-antigen/teichoic acid export membrane protein